MKDYEQLDQLLKQALAPTIGPDKELNQKIINRLKERDIMKPVFKGMRKLSAALVAAAITVTMTITAYAAWNLLKPRQVAEHIGDKTLAQAFEDKNAIEINKSVSSGGYNFTLLGIVSGSNLSQFKSSAQDIHPDRTYAVVSITKQDGSRMPDTKDEEYAKVPFFVSPLIKGQKPWQVNIASMNGGYCEFVADGVMYRLIECDGIEMFADRGLYLCISTGSFYDIDAFNYNEETGEVSPRADYNGANALFDLPLDKSKADHDRAEKYLQDLLKPAEDSSSSRQASVDWDKVFANAEAVPGSEKVVTYDKDGLAHYEYENNKFSVNLKYLFDGAPEVVSKVVSVYGENNNDHALQLSRDADGVVTARILKLK